jgi:hypothetical protein
MSIAQTVLVFAGIPAGVVAVLAALIWGRGELRQPNRYRPGKPWNFPPVWYVPHPQAQPMTGERRALGAAKRAAIESGESPAPTPSAVGGASGEW